MSVLTAWQLAPPEQVIPEKEGKEESAVPFMTVSESTRHHAFVFRSLEASH